MFDPVPPAANTAPPPIVHHAPGIKVTGRPRVTTPAPIEQPAAPPMKVPGIIASHTNLYIPTGHAGTTMLTWDGGEDHPYAEVWIKVGDGDETFVIEQGKGTLKVDVEKGKTYLYILTDAGKRLATVTVTSRK